MSSPKETLTWLIRKCLALPSDWFLVVGKLENLSPAPAEEDEFR